MTLQVDERVIGHYEGSAGGPRVIVTGGVHGNEPAGIIAFGRVLDKLVESAPLFSGKLLGLAGNRAALALGQRYVEEDLNRIWLPERLRGDSNTTHPARTVDEVEQWELLREIQLVLNDFDGTAYFLDLHTTSAKGAPFSVLADTLANRRLAKRLPGAMVLGLEEHLDGTLLNFVNELGHVAIGFEGGRHGSPEAIDAQELALWETLVMAGCVRRHEIPGLSTLSESVDARAAGTPRVVEIRHRHHVEFEDEFLMGPGCRNLQRIKRGQVLARDRNGEIVSSEDGRILMPLYQSQGSDGFFVVREVRSFWLALAVWMRRFRLDKVVPFMPGVTPHPALPDTYVVNRTVARWFVVEVFHLLGFRRNRFEAGRLVVSRRKETPVGNL